MKLIQQHFPIFSLKYIFKLVSTYTKLIVCLASIIFLAFLEKMNICLFKKMFVILLAVFMVAPLEQTVPADVCGSCSTHCGSCLDGCQKYCEYCPSPPYSSTGCQQCIDYLVIGCKI